MTNYEIVPETTLYLRSVNYKTDVYNDTSLSKCRNICDNLNQACSGFVWEDVGSGICHLYPVINTPDLLTKYNVNSTLYIKKGRSNFILFWIFLAIFLIIVFISLCKRSK